MGNGFIEKCFDYPFPQNFDKCINCKLPLTWHNRSSFQLFWQKWNIIVEGKVTGRENAEGLFRDYPSKVQKGFIKQKAIRGDIAILVGRTQNEPPPAWNLIKYANLINPNSDADKRQLNCWSKLQILTQIEPIQRCILSKNNNRTLYFHKHIHHFLLASIQLNWALIISKKVSI